ncbi:polymorphic toxin type 15 domain-containing protein [Shewanella woodyi]|uniref:polymorphic toxin type 15 domain-containing protein n=1 Tax=Shewanella woodyi TaxID=60961 RepID=UPI000300518B|nr:polymorphic toxin type 15 domain-containing protein [Shewanella woodyi]
MSVLTDSDWQSITPSGRSPERVKSELEQGTYVVLRDSPASPVFSMEQGIPLASSAFAGGISAQTVSQLTNRFQSAGRVGAAAPNNGNLDPAPPLDYIADTSQVKEAKEESKPALISDNFGKAPPKLELQLCYDDSEKTYASDVPYSVIFSDPGKTVIKGVLNDQGWAMVEGGPNYPAKVIFGDEAEKAAAELALKDQYKQLDQALNDTAKQVVDHLLAAKEKAKQTQLIEVTESFKLAVDNKIAALNAESEAFDNLSYLSQTWEIAKATKEGASNGFTEYIPDLGDFGALMDAADIDITMLIEAISTGNIDTLEAKLQQWKDRGGQGLNEARKTMETLILLLSDPTSREMLASVPKRIIAALPEDQVAELTAYQTTQLGMDTAVVGGGAAVGTLAGGVGGPVAAGMLFAATTARKGGKALEGTINIVADISKSLKKINNQHDIVPYKKDNELSLSKGQPTRKDKDVQKVKPVVAPRHNVACFKKNKKGDAEEYDRQLKGQQNGLNDMTVQQYLDNRKAYNAIGRKGTGAAQKEAREKFRDKLISEYKNDLIDSGEYFGQEAVEKATNLAMKEMKTLNALHNPDMIAGGKDEVFDLGNSSVNQSIGSQWKSKGTEKSSRVALMDIEAEKALAESGPNTKMNVDLHRCK